jgi:hypothetical protein
VEETKREKKSKGSTKYARNKLKIQERTQKIKKQTHQERLKERNVKPNEIN